LWKASARNVEELDDADAHAFEDVGMNSNWFGSIDTADRDRRVLGEGESSQHEKSKLLIPGMVVRLRGAVSGKFCASYRSKDKAKQVGSHCKATEDDSVQYSVVDAGFGFIGLSVTKGAFSNSRGGLTDSNTFIVADVTKRSKRKTETEKVTLMTKGAGLFCSDRDYRITCDRRSVSKNEQFEVDCLSGCTEETRAEIIKNEAQVRYANMEKHAAEQAALKKAALVKATASLAAKMAKMTATKAMKAAVEEKATADKAEQATEQQLQNVTQVYKAMKASFLSAEKKAEKDTASAKKAALDAKSEEQRQKEFQEASKAKYEAKEKESQQKGSLKGFLKKQAAKKELEQQKIKVKKELALKFDAQARQEVEQAAAMKKVLRQSAKEEISANETASEAKSHAKAESVKAAADKQVAIAAEVTAVAADKQASNDTKAEAQKIVAERKSMEASEDAKKAALTDEKIIALAQKVHRAKAAMDDASDKSSLAMDTVSTLDRALKRSLEQKAELLKQKKAADALAEALSKHVSLRAAEIRAMKKHWATNYALTTAERLSRDMMPPAEMARTTIPWLSQPVKDSSTSESSALAFGPIVEVGVESLQQMTQANNKAASTWVKLQQVRRAVTAETTAAKMAKKQMETATIRVVNVTGEYTAANEEAKKLGIDVDTEFISPVEMSCRKLGDWISMGNIMNSKAGVKECEEKCSTKKYSFFGFECPKITKTIVKVKSSEDVIEKSTASCKCAKDLNKSRKLGPQRCMKPSRFAKHYGCVGPYRTGPYMMGSKDVGSVYMTRYGYQEMTVRADKAAQLERIKASTLMHKELMVEEKLHADAELNEEELKKVEKHNKAMSELEQKIGQQVQVGNMDKAKELKEEYFEKRDERDIAAGVKLDPDAR